VDVPSEAVGGHFDEVRLTNEVQPEFEDVFRAQYQRITRVIGRVIRDPARAEELAVEVFLKWSRKPSLSGDNPEGWLYRTAVRTALNELRAEARRARYERLFGFLPSTNRRQTPTPEDLRAANEDRERVRAVLSRIKRREAGLLVLRSHGFTYEELATTLELNPLSIGTLLARAQQAFRREYITRYGDE
jgi:RNA polymerase sigma-70 factor (ECF subfamily)